MADAKPATSPANAPATPTAPTTPWIGGYQWNPLLVDWKQGPEGAWVKHDKRGRPAIGHKFWGLGLDDGQGIGDAVYALHRSAGTVYIGRASDAPKGGPQLTVRLKAHWQTDKHENRWNSFSWIATNKNGGKPANTSLGFIELIAIRFANPIDNGQMPNLDSQITWLRQVEQVTPNPTEVHMRTFLLQ